MHFAFLVMIRWEVRHQACLDRRHLEHWWAIDMAGLEIERRELAGAAQDRKRSL